MLLTDLADACRKSGLPVVEEVGWRTRGHGHFAGLMGIVCHHTATPAAAPGDYPSLRIVRDGRSDLPGPLSQLGLGRDGTVYVIAAGVAWHAGATSLPRQDNWHTIGIEAEHDGVSRWAPEQYAAYASLAATLAEHYGIPLSNVEGHKEVATPRGRKIDPNFDMDAFRGVVKQMRDARTQPDPRDAVRPDLNAAMKHTKAADALVKGRPRLKFAIGKMRYWTRRARRINRGD